MNLALIPARGGSRRIPRKNVRDFAGRPILAYAIEAATRSGVFDRVIVSTDDDEIATAALAAGAEVPFVRPAELADDHTSTRSVVRHALHRLGAPEGVTCCLYPTAPFVRRSDLLEAMETLEARTDAMTAMTVTSLEELPWRAFRLHDGRLTRLFPEYAKTRTQDLPAVFRDAGQFYVARNERWLDEDTPLTHEALPIVIPPERAIDIDTEEDWSRALAAFLERGGAGAEPETPCA